MTGRESKITRDDELWIAAKQAACHFWDPANDGKVATRDQVEAIGFMIAFIARWQGGVSKTAAPAEGAQFEREMILERQKEGIAKAKAEGKYKGRAPTARAKSGDTKRLAAEDMTREAIAAQLKIGVASVYRVLRAA